MSFGKAKSAQNAFANYIASVQKYRPKLGFQGDGVGGVDACNKQSDHSIYLSAKFFGNFYTLKSLTSVNGEVVALSGPVVNPYPDGKLGVIEAGAYADLSMAIRYKIYRSLAPIQNGLMHQAVTASIASA